MSSRRILLVLATTLPAASCRSDSPTTKPAADAAAPVDVTIDTAGVPHIYAQTDLGVFYGQGWAAASQRMFQMDLLRRRAWGRRAEVLGEGYANGDLQSMALGFGDWGTRTAAVLPQTDPAFHAMLEAYRDGVNAWLADARTGVHGQSLPPQFVALGYEPEPWTIEDTMAIEKLISAGLSMRPDQDITLGLLDVLFGPELLNDLYWHAPFDPEWVVPGFYDDVAGPPPPAPATPPPARLPAIDADPRDIARSIQQLSEWKMHLGGSNNQAVAGALTDSGHALLASDSHQGVAHPAVYWLVHLDSVSRGQGTVDVVGASFPGVPMVLFGTNGRVAWGPTTSIYDASDAWLETWADGTQQAVIFEGAEVPVERTTATLRVRAEGGSVADAEARTVELATVPHHGPMLPTESMGLPLPLAISIGWTGYQARSIGPAFLGMSRANDIDGVYEALGGYFTGGMHFVFADDAGRIGYDSTTDLPIRERLDPENPPITLLPGEGGYEWTPATSGDTPFATLPREAIPHVLDPADGILATANNDPVGQTADNDPYNDPVYLSAIFDIGTRAWQPRRMLEDISAERPVTFDDMVTVQLDTTSRLAARLLPYLAIAAERRPDLLTDDARQALHLLEEWDLRCETDAAGPTLFHAWLITLGKAVLADESDLLAELLFDDLDYTLGLVVSKFLLRWLEATADDIDAIEAGDLPFPSASGRNFFDDRTTTELETRDEVLVRALVDSIAAVRPALVAQGADASDLSTWTWGRWHVMHLEDPGLPAASSGTFPKAGGLYTVDVGDFDWLEGGALPDQLLVSNAPSNRFVYELEPGDPRIWMVLPGGQAESPDSPFHNSMLEDYLGGGYLEIPFLVEDVDAAAVETLTLTR